MEKRAEVLAERFRREIVSAQEAPEKLQALYPRLLRITLKDGEEPVIAPRVREFLSKVRQSRPRVVDRSARA